MTNENIKITQSPVRSISALVVENGGSLFRLLLYMDDLNEKQVSVSSFLIRVNLQRSHSSDCPPF